MGNHLHTVVLIGCEGLTSFSILVSIMSHFHVPVLFCHLFFSSVIVILLFLMLCTWNISRSEIHVYPSIHLLPACICSLKVVEGMAEMLAQILLSFFWLFSQK